jgi:DNA-binding NarL/FixJ family response regulator
VALACLLTARQLDVLALLCWGFKRRAIAKSLGIGEGTVRGYQALLYRRLGVYDRNGAAMLVLRERRR